VGETPSDLTFSGGYDVSFQALDGGPEPEKRKGSTEVDGLDNCQDVDG
jgi:hypothetical protein